MSYLKPKWTVYNLDKFPFVCRLCLRPDSSAPDMISLQTSDPVFDGTILEFITAITFVISEDKSHLLPQTVCLECLDLLKFFAKYRNKLMITHLLMNSLVELKRDNSVPIIDLFNGKKEMLRDLCKDLELCNKETVLVQDLLDEFSAYDIASLSEDVKVAVSEDMEKISVEEVNTEPDFIFAEECTQVVNTEPDFIFAEECTPEELTELIVEKKPKRPARKPKELRESDLSIANIDETPVDEAAPTTVSKRYAYGGKKLEKPIQCPKCEYETFYIRNFHTHQLVHAKREKKRYPCIEPGCSEVFLHRKLLQNHTGTVHKPLICETCGHRSATRTYLKVHMERHMKQFKHICTYCEKAYNTKCDLRNHVKLMHLADGNFPCETCGLVFKRKDCRNNHERTHKDVFDFPCDMCEKKFKNPNGLKRHKNVIHKLKRFGCDHCDSTYPTKTKLLDHVEYAHRVQSRFLCDVCVQVFHKQEDLNTHAARHRNPKEHECGVCLCLYASPELMENHLCITYRDDYICCDRDQRHFYMYNKHMFTKHGITTNVRVKPVQGQLLGYLRAKRKRVETCPKCEKMFPTRTQKKMHMEICVGPKETALSEGISYGEAI